MKARLFTLWVFALLVACSSSPIGNVNATITPNGVATDTANQIGTAVAAKGTENAVKALFTPTPTPGETALRDLILSSAEVNELANRWSAAPVDGSASLNPEYCEIECAFLIWPGGTEGNSALEITLIQAGSRDEAVTLFNALRVEIVSDANPEILLPELVVLPEGTFAFEDQSKPTTFWSVIARQGATLVRIGIYMPDLSQDENLLILSLFADKQIQKLITAGH